MSEEAFPYENTSVAIPSDVATCPYCGADLFVEVTGWIEAQADTPIVALAKGEDRTTWEVESIDVDCENEPEWETPAWDTWSAEHSRMPYVYMLPVEMKIIDWLNQQLQPNAPSKDIPCPRTLDLFVP